MLLRRRRGQPRAVPRGPQLGADLPPAGAVRLRGQPLLGHDRDRGDDRRRGRGGARACDRPARPGRRRQRRRGGRRRRVGGRRKCAPGAAGAVCTRSPIASRATCRSIPARTVTRRGRTRAARSPLAGPPPSCSLRSAWRPRPRPDRARGPRREIAGAVRPPMRPPRLRRRRPIATSSTAGVVDGSDPDLRAGRGRGAGRGDGRRRADRRARRGPRAWRGIRQYRVAVPASDVAGSGAGTGRGAGTGTRRATSTAAGASAAVPRRCRRSSSGSAATASSTPRSPRRRSWERPSAWRSPGCKPVVEMRVVDFALCAMDELVNQAAKNRYMFGGQSRVPLIARMPIGIWSASAAQHSQSFEAWFAHVPGLAVVCPATAQDNHSLLRAALDCGDPVAYLEHKELWGQEGEVDPALTVRLGEAAVRHEGSDLTIVSWSRTAGEAVAAARTLAADGIGCDVIDLRTIWPWDRDRVLASCAKTGRLLVTHEAVQVAGFGAEIAAAVAEELGCRGRALAPRGSPSATRRSRPRRESAPKTSPPRSSRSAIAGDRTPPAGERGARDRRWTGRRGDRPWRACARLRRARRRRAERRAARRARACLPPVR